MDWVYLGSDHLLFLIKLMDDTRSGCICQKIVLLLLERRENPTHSKRVKCHRITQQQGDKNRGKQVFDCTGHYKAFSVIHSTS